MKIVIERKTDQWNNEDFIPGPRVFTISGVVPGKAEAKYDVQFSDGDGKVWRPSNGMLELLAKLWGYETSEWLGRKVELFRDPEVKMGRDRVGGIRVRAMSHIDGPQAPLIVVSRGKRAPYPVQPLAAEFDESAVVDVLAEINNAESLPALKAVWDVAGVKGVQKHPDVITAKEKRKRELT